MQSFNMSDQKIMDYYRGNPPQPTFGFSDTLQHKIYYAFAGDSTKPLLFLVHGAPGAWFGYKEFFNDTLLLNKFQMMAPDRAGYHKSVESETSIAGQALLLKPLLRKHDRQKVTLLGRSYGAAIAVKMAIENPDIVEKLILISPACDPAKEKFWWFSKPVNTTFARFFLPKYVNRASDEKFAHRSELEKLLPDWRKIKCPVTILQGGEDWIIDITNGNFVDSVLVNAPRRYIFLPQNGHLLTDERYELIRNILLEN